MTQYALDKVTLILEAGFPDEAEYVGPVVLEEIAEGIEFEQTEGGSNLDISTAIVTLAAAATFIKTVLDIYLLLRNKLGRNPQTKEVENAIQQEEIDTNKLDSETLRMLIRLVIENA